MTTTELKDGDRRAGSVATVLTAQGFTLVEVMIVVVIVGILVVALGFQFVNWKAGYLMEGTVKEVYINLMRARSEAMQRKTLVFVNASGADPITTYKMYVDDYPAPYGDGVLQDDTNTNPDSYLDKKRTYYDLNQKSPTGTRQTTEIKMIPKENHFGFTRGGVLFKASGIVQGEALTIAFEALDQDPEYPVIGDYDCLLLESTRINMGKMENGICKGK